MDQGLVTFSMHGEHPSNRTAAEWIARLNADQRTARDEAEFRAWLAADPAHAADFERATDLWDMIPGASPLRTPPPRSPVLTRRRMIAGLAATAGACGVGGLALQSAYAGTLYQTGVGEQRCVTLHEGSLLLLDAQTRVRVRVTDRVRRLWLTEGRVSLSVVPAAEPFTVDAGAGSLIASRGRFDLRRNAADDVSLIAISGRASVSTEGTHHLLSQGERLRAQAGRPSALDQPDLAAAEAWQHGRAAFHNDPLSAVAAEANRYSTHRLVILDPRTAAMRVSGMYRMGDNAALGRALSELLAIRIQQTDTAVMLGG